MSRFLILLLFVCAAANAGLREDLIDKYSVEFIRANAQYNYADFAGEPTEYIKGRRDTYYEITEYLWTLPNTIEIRELDELTSGCDSDPSGSAVAVDVSTR